MWEVTLRDDDGTVWQGYETAADAREAEWKVLTRMEQDGRVGTGWRYVQASDVSVK
jgi:hypothetical protein